MSHKIQNPIIPGFYPDPSICRVGEDFYLANSSFELSPGIPIFHSKDLANWEQIGYAISPENGFKMDKGSMVGGVMAPTIRYHDGLFYIINANFADRGNFIITAENPAGPWSMPHYLDDVPGIDASLFFDDDGQCYIIGTGNVWDNGTGVMERGIWLAKYDIVNFCMTGEPVTIFNSAMRGAASPESPHLYHIGDYYYLMIAEGGTEHYHSVVVARSKDIFAFYENCPANPVLTHRHMGFRSPLINMGHADFVDTPAGEWYAVLLGSRLIEGKCKNLGRETFIVPVEWERDWPLFSPETGKVEMEYDAPASLPWTEYPEETAFDDFDSDKLALYWNTWGIPAEGVISVYDSNVKLRCIRQALADELEPMFGVEKRDDKYVSALLRRQRAISTTATCKMHFMPMGPESAGMAVVQAMNHQFHLERAESEGRQVVRLVQTSAEYPCPPYFPGFTSKTSCNVIAEAEWDADEIVMQIEIDGETFTIRYGSDRNSLINLCIADGTLINPEKVGCMAGTMIGIYASGNGTESDNTAAFDWFELK
jgi:alpha-N-arabinofuranosidase